MEKVNRADLIKKLSPDELALYLYLNSKATSKGLKKLKEWTKEEVDSDEERYIKKEEI